jgi:hypothetical protein
MILLRYHKGLGNVKGDAFLLRLVRADYSMAEKESNKFLHGKANDIAA